MTPSERLLPAKPGQVLIHLVLLFAGAIWIWFSRVSPQDVLADSRIAPRPGFQAPDFNLSTSQGTQISLSTLHGQPVIINLWASWCPPCREEMPALQKVYETYHEQGLEILGVNATNQDDVQAANEFSNRLGLTFPILLDGDGRVSRLYQLQSLPTTFFVGRDGSIQDVIIGGPMAEALLRVRVEHLLGKVQP
jgi:cytochrome c biogenesis protein CcmG/thiol:disulfide interchange protein DsbE